MTYLKYAALFVMIGLATALAAWDAARAQEEAAAEPPPPANQTYIGTRRCAACHFDQYMQWRKSKHSKTFQLLPANYQSDAKCLKCHTTGYGEETGYKTVADADLQNTTCEACHGPGSEHEVVAKKFGDQKLNPAQEKEARDSIWKMLPRNVCVECHQVQAHKESQTPPALRK